MIRTATFVADVSSQFVGHACVYRVTPPMHVGEGEGTTRFVVVSTAETYNGPETFIFPSNETGQVTDWFELDGSIRGKIEHSDALENAGYSLTETERAAP